MGEVLIIGSRVTDTVPLVLNELQRRGRSVAFVDHDDGDDWCLWLDRNGIALHDPTGRAVHPACVWLRFKRHEIRTALTESEVVKQVASSEWSSFARGVALLYGDRALNHHSRRSVASFKIFQHQIALASGFNCLESKVFFRKARAADCVGRGPQVLKALGHPEVSSLRTFGERDHLITTAVSSELVESTAEEDFMDAPTWFQERVRSGTEIRVHVFGETVFAYRDAKTVCSRRLPDGRVFRPEFSRASLEAPVKQMVLTFMRLAGLDYATFDIIEDGDRTWFLECNPEGQWHAADGRDLESNIVAFADLIDARIEKSNA